MKKAIIILTLALLLLCSACHASGNNTQQTAPTGNQVSDAYVSFLVKDPAETEAYNAAVDTYNDFLNGITQAKSLKSGDSFSICEMYDMQFKPGINQYALLDVNQDGIPELHTKSYAYDIFSIQDGKVVHVCTAPMHDTYLLENGTLVMIANTTGRTYHFYTVNAALDVTLTYFFDGKGSAINEAYHFNGQAVSKSEFEELTATYFAMLNSPAAMEWHIY